MEKIIVFGVGKRLNHLLEDGYLDEFEVVVFCDNDVKKQGMQIEGIEIIAPQKIKEYEFDAIYISSEDYFDDIKRQLTEELEITSDVIKYFKVKKYDGELGYWKDKFEAEGRRFQNTHYEKLMLSIAEENDDKFLDGKNVADFGCGPRGSLAWTDSPAVKLGIDVLSKDYLENFGDELINHGMIYVTSSESKIPIPDEFVDCLFTINSLDHVNKLREMTGELLRILKRGGTLLASFNLNEPCTVCEPQTLTEDLVKNVILQYFDIESYRMSYKDEKDTYLNIFNNRFVDTLENGRPGVLWVKGKKK